MTLRSLAGAVTLSLVAALAVPVAAQAGYRHRRHNGYRSYSNSYNYKPYYYGYGSYGYSRPYYRSYYRSYYAPRYRSYAPRCYRPGVSFFFGF